MIPFAAEPFSSPCAAPALPERAPVRARPPDRGAKAAAPVDPRPLDDEALLALVAGSCSRAGQARQRGAGLGGELLARFGHLGHLARACAPELSSEGGLGAPAATRLAGAFELGRRALVRPWPDDTPFSDAEDVWAHYRGRLGLLDHELFLVVGLDVRCRRVCEARVAQGTLARCVVQPRDVFLPALRAAAHTVLLVHNHPSGDPTPSADDRSLTARLVLVGQALDVPVVDHVVVARAGYCSLAEEGSL